MVLLNRNAPRGNDVGIVDAMQRGEGRHEASPQTITQKTNDTTSHTRTKAHKRPLGNLTK